MSMFENNQYRWRETCFVLFQSSERPTLEVVEETLTALDPSYRLQDKLADDDGRFDSLTLLSPDDFAALDICFTCGPEILEQGATLCDELESAACEIDEPEGGDDDFDEVLDPGALLIVLDALAKLTDGIAVDPQTGSVLSDDI